MDNSIIGRDIDIEVDKSTMKLIRTMSYEDWRQLFNDYKNGLITAEQCISLVNYSFGCDMYGILKEQQLKEQAMKSKLEETKKK